MKKLIVAALGAGLAAGCSNLPSSPDASGPARADAQARNGIALQPSLVVSNDTVRIAADGDVKNGPLDIVRVRVRQGGNAFYAQPSGSYAVFAEQPLDVWVEWSSDRPLTDPPRLIIDWGTGAGGGDNIHCGPCLLSRTYPTVGRYQVTITLDDRISGVTRRTFTFNASSPRVPGASAISQTTSPWSITFLVTNPVNSEVTVNIRAVTWHRADTGAQVGQQADIAPWVTLSAAQLPANVTVPGGLGCAVTGGAQGQFRFIIDLVSGDGTTSQTPIVSIPFPCT